MVFPNRQQHPGGMAAHTSRGVCRQDSSAAHSAGLMPTTPLPVPTPSRPRPAVSSPANDLHQAKDKGRQGVRQLHARGNVHLGDGARTATGWGQDRASPLVHCSNCCFVRSFVGQTIWESAPRSRSKHPCSSPTCQLAGCKHVARPGPRGLCTAIKPAPWLAVPGFSPPSCRRTAGQTWTA